MANSSVDALRRGFPEILGVPEALVEAEKLIAAGRVARISDTDLLGLRHELDTFQREVLRQAGAVEARLQDRRAEAAKPFMQRKGWSIAGAVFTVGGAVVATVTLDISTIGAAVGCVCSLGGFATLLGQTIAAKRGSRSAADLLFTARSIEAAERRLRKCRREIEREYHRRNLP